MEARPARLSDTAVPRGSDRAVEHEDLRGRAISATVIAIRAGSSQRRGPAERHAGRPSPPGCRPRAGERESQRVTSPSSVPMAVRAGVAASCRSAVSISTGPTISGNAPTRPATSCPQRRPASVDRSTSAAARSAPRTSSIRRRSPQCGEQRDLHCGVGEVDGGDSPPGYVDDVDRHQAAGTSGGNGLDLSVARSDAAAPTRPAPTEATSRPTVSTSHHSRLGPVTASKARRDANGATPVAT
jgi:hypothetical protein